MPFKPGGEWPIPMGRVKLPEPLVSDYIAPSSATSSSTDPTAGSTPDVVESFESGTDGWSAYIIQFYGINTSSVSVSSSTDRTTDGSHSLKASVTPTSYSSLCTNGGGGVAKTIDVTDYAKIVLDVAAVLGSDQYGSCGPYSRYLYVDIGDTNVFTLEVTPSQGVPYDTGWQTVTIDTSNMTGSKTIKVYVEVPSDTNSTSYVYVDNVRYYKAQYSAGYIHDGDTSTVWKPASANAGEWLYVDLGTPTIVGGARIYWGSSVPQAYRIQASTDASTWYDVYSVQAPPQASSWAEYGWPAIYARYLRLYFDDTGGVAPEVAEFQYYSQITDRVAAEHGHGSGPEPWKKGAFQSAFDLAMKKGKRPPKLASIRGFSVAGRIDSLINDLNSSKQVDPQKLAELTELLKRYIELRTP